MGLRGPFGEKENKREKGKRGAATLVGHMGEPRGLASLPLLYIGVPSCLENYPSPFFFSPTLNGVPNLELRRRREVSL